MRELKRLFKDEFKVCLMSHSSNSELHSYGFGLARVLSFARKHIPDALYSFHNMKAGYGNAGQDTGIILEQRPDLLGLSVCFWNIDRVEQILRGVRTSLPDTVVVLGGPSASGYGIQTNLPWLPDFIVHGEGEPAFLSLMEGLIRDDPKIQRVLNTRVEDRQKGRFQPMVLENVPTDLDTLGSPYLENIFTPPGELLYLESSRGCPNMCAFCVCGDSKHTLRYFDREMTRNELEWAVQNNKRKINFCDAALNYDSDHLRGIIGASHDADPGQSLSYTFALHSDYLNSDQIRLMSKWNIDCVTMGLNSINPQTFRPIRRGIDLSRFKESVRLIKELPNANITIMLGLPGDTVDGFRMTLEFCASLDIQVNCYELRVFPGTFFFDNASAFELRYDPADGMKAHSCFSFTENDMDTMREIFDSYIQTGCRFVRGDAD